MLMLLILISSALAQLADSPSPTLKANLKRTGLSPYTTDIEKPYLKWKFDTGNGVESAPAIGKDGTIYTGSFSDNFYALNPDGKIKWKFEEKGTHFRSSPTISDDGTIYVIAAADLRPLYNPALDDYDDMFGIPKLYALDSDGKIKWKFVLGGLASGVLYSPAIAKDGTIYCISGGAKKGGTTDDPDILRGDSFWAINPDGKEKWRFKTGDAMYSGPAIADDGTIYFGCTDGNAYALNPDGTEKWRFNTGEDAKQRGDSFNAVPSIAEDGTVYFGGYDENLYALSPDGKVKWKFKMQEKIEATPSIGADGTIYAGAYSPGRDKYLYALTPEGKEIWRFETGQGVYGAPAIDANGILYFGSYDGYLYSLNPDGSERWRFKSGGGITMPPAIGSDGTVYFGSWDNYLYALDGKGEVEEKGTEEDGREWDSDDEISENNGFWDEKNDGDESFEEAECGNGICESGEERYCHDDCGRKDYRDSEEVEDLKEIENREERVYQKEEDRNGKEGGFFSKLINFLKGLFD